MRSPSCCAVMLIRAEGDMSGLDGGCNLPAEGNDFTRDYLGGVGFVLPVHPAGNQQGLVALDQLGAGLEKVGKDDDLDHPFQVLKRDKAHPLPLAVVDFADFAGDARNPDLAVLGKIDDGQGVGGGVLLDIILELIEGVLADEEAQRLLFVA